MSEDYQKLSKIAKKRIDKKMYIGINSIKDTHERNELFGKALMQNIKHEIRSLYNEVDILAQLKKDVFAIKIKLLYIENRLHFFNANYSIKEFKKIVSVIKNIKKEINYEKSI